MIFFTNYFLLNKLAIFNIFICKKIIAILKFYYHKILNLKKSQKKPKKKRKKIFYCDFLFYINTILICIFYNKINMEKIIAILNSTV